MNLTGILLCGGKSSRMGKDKALIEVQDRPMYSIPLKLLQNYCSEILISANDGRFNNLGYPVIKDEFIDIGPMGGIYSCLKQARNSHCLVLACDMPLVTGNIIDRMLSKNEDFDAICPMLNNKPEPLQAMYHKRITGLIELSIRSNTYSIQKLLSKLSVHYIEIKNENRVELFNANTPNDLIQYEQIIRTKLS